MADIESDFRTLALQGPSISTTFGNRFYWSRIPDSTAYPCVRAVVVSDPQIDTHSGNVGGRMTVQLDVYNDGDLVCRTSADLLKAWLHNYRGAMGSQSVTIKARNPVNIDESDTRLFRRMIQVEVLYLNQV